MIQTDEDDEFDRILRENRIKGQAYHFPEPRTWIGLTDEEVSELIRTTHNTGSFVRAIEAKLKEKNT